MVFSDGGSSVSYSFSGTTGSGSTNNGFIIGGQNTLKAIINNTDGGITGSMRSIATSSGDHMGFAVNGTISYNSAHFAQTDMATLNGTQENSITLLTSANLSGSFP
jgi:hypothetical protein